MSRSVSFFSAGKRFTQGSGDESKDSTFTEKGKDNSYVFRFETECACNLVRCNVVFDNRISWMLVTLQESRRLERNGSNVLSRSKWHLT